jgi:hypothetical protein
VKRFAYALCLVVFAACGGGGGSSVSIVGDPPAEQAAEIADAICDQLVECGEVAVDCTFNQETQMIECVGTIEDVDHAACVGENEPDILADLEACELTAEEEQLGEDCINAQLAQPCVTQEELDEYIEETEMGNEPPPLRDLPESCEEFFAIIEACSPDPQ